MANPIFTIGHSRRPIDEFVELLRASGITLLADVRTIPRSRTNPQFNRETLPATLAPYQIGYEHMPALGGLRSKQRTVPPDVNGYWSNDSFHNFADYALGETFHEGIHHLRALGRQKVCAVMCSEAVWWRCHRRIITDYLLAGGESVLHILGENHVDPATMTPGAVADGADVRYPPSQGQLSL